MSETVPEPAGDRQAAVLLDYQNLHHYLKSRVGQGSTADLAGLLLRALRDRLAADDTRLVRGRAYADFGGLDDHTRHVQRTLYLHAIEPVYVPTTMHRNTTDLQLAVDAVEMRNGHPELDTFVLMAGDRDYAPVVTALLAHGKHVLVVGFKEHLSPHLLEHTDGGAFLDAEALLPSDALPPEIEVGAAIEVTEFAETQDPAYEIDYDALEVVEKFFGQYQEIYLTPLLRRLSDEIGEVEGHDPKSLVADLEECGARPAGAPARDALRLHRAPGQRRAPGRGRGPGGGPRGARRGRRRRAALRGRAGDLGQGVAA